MKLKKYTNQLSPRTLHYYNNVISNRIPRITFPTLPPLIQRGVFESKHHFELFKIFSSKRFGEDVRNLLICGTMSQVYSLGLYMILNQVILCVDVLCSIMESRILGQLDCKSIFNSKRSRIHLFLLQIFKYFPDLHNLLCCFCSCHIFFLCCGICWN